MDVRVSYQSSEQLVNILRHWATYIKIGLERRFPETDAIKWYEDRLKSDNAASAEYLHWFDVMQNNTLAGRVRLTWNATKPDWLGITAGSDGLAETKSFLGKIFDRLSLLAAIAAFLLWVWFVSEDWHRVWNRVSSFTAGYDSGHASKLGVFWLFLGWILGPVFAGFGFSMIGDWFDERAHQRKKAKLEAFARNHLDGAISELIDQALAECAHDVSLCANLGQAHPGSPHPTLPNIIYGEKGDLCPAAGYQWVTDDTKSTEVKLATS